MGAGSVEAEDENVEDGAGTAEPQQNALDPALSCFVLLARFLGVPADPGQIAHERG